MHAGSEHCYSKRRRRGKGERAGSGMEGDKECWVVMKCPGWVVPWSSAMLISASGGQCRLISTRLRKWRESLTHTQSGLTLSRVTNGAQQEGGDPVNWGTRTISSVS